MSLEEDLLAIETELWTGGPEAYRSTPMTNAWWCSPRWPGR